jgi:carbon starvation protein CstA
VLAVLGVIVLPITSGDTAFRVARLITADYLKLPQKRVANRYKIALPLFGLSLILQFIPFGVIWRYFGWANQTLSAITLWTGAVFLARRGRWWWIAALPATFMTVMTFTFILVSDKGLALSQTLGTVLGLALGAGALAAFLLLLPRLQPEDDQVKVPGEAVSEAERQADHLAS